MMSSSVPYTVTKPPSAWPAILLAILVHAVLFAFLWVGINWVNNTPETIEAEVWSTKELEQAPPPPVQPPPQPEVVKPQPQVQEKPEVEKPDIALEQEKKRKQLEKEKQAREEEAQEKKKEAAAQKKKEDDEKKLADEKKRKQDDLDAKKMKQLADAERKRILGEADSTSTNGTADRSQGNTNSTAWVGRIKRIIKSHMSFPVTDDNNDPAEFDVDLLPGGAIAGIVKVKSSGNPRFDDAVLSAIRASEPFPPDSSGKYPMKKLPISYRPKD